MKYVDEYCNGKIAEGLVSNIARISRRPTKLMEVCGTHTVSIFKHGIKGLMPHNITLLSGPGCPVCVTPNYSIDRVIAIARERNVILVTFGDMMRVPGSSSSLEKEKAKGYDIRIVYSPMDALKVARENPTKKVVFYAIGFETTSPTIAASILEAERMSLDNFFILGAHKLIPPAIKALLDFKELKIDGFILPGHVSVIIGSEPYGFIANDYGIAAVISGFEPLDILQTIYMLIKQIELSEPKIEIQYRRGVRREGNRVALKILSRVFETCDTNWRGIGIIPNSGLRLRKEYKRFDAEENFEVKVEKEREAKGCICGDILRGVKTPKECSLFIKICTPLSPVGACMVSSEGTCAAWFKYGQ